MQRHDHGHDHGHHHHHADSGRALTLSLALTLGFAAAEAVGGWWAGSLALISDAGHMVSDAAAMGLAALAAWIARRPPSRRHSFGYGRAEVVAALVNGGFMLALVTIIAIEAVQRFLEPRPVAGGTVMVIALLGLFVNLAVLFVLSRGEATLNTRGALLHVMGDLLGSVAALLSGAIIYWTGWTVVDPVLSLLICAIILNSSLRLLREALHVVMEGVPLQLDLEEVGLTMARVDGVESVHDLHIWNAGSEMVALSAHVVVRELGDWQAVLDALRGMLADRYGIEHVTLQPEPPAEFTLVRH